MRVTQFGRIRLCLSIAVVLLAVFPAATSARDATGYFEIYCDGVGFFLAKVDGAPTPGKLLLFLYAGFPGIPYVPRETWKDVSVYRNGCIADGKCEVIARGIIWLADEAIGCTWSHDISPLGLSTSGWGRFAVWRTRPPTAASSAPTWRPESGASRA
jgi:hypothetical protein